MVSRTSLLLETGKTFVTFAVLKIIFLDILLSFGDAVTDILQGFYLICWFERDTYKLQMKEDTFYYGVVMLVICWVPGLICVLHILAHYRWTVDQ